MIIYKLSVGPDSTVKGIDLPEMHFQEKHTLEATVRTFEKLVKYDVNFDWYAEEIYIISNAEALKVFLEHVNTMENEGTIN